MIVASRNSLFLFLTISYTRLCTKQKKEKDSYKNFHTKVIQTLLFGKQRISCFFRRTMSVCCGFFGFFSRKKNLVVISGAILDFVVFFTTKGISNFFLILYIL